MTLCFVQRSYLHIICVLSQILTLSYRSMGAILDLTRLGVMQDLQILKASGYTCIQHSAKILRQYIHNFFSFNYFSNCISHILRKYGSHLGFGEVGGNIGFCDFTGICAYTLPTQGKKIRLIYS